jgi:hypothetical protein
MKHSKKSSSKFMNDIQSLFRNIYVLYTLVIIAVVYLFMLLSMNNFNAIGFFLLLGIIVYCYTKNMSIILTACILFTLIIFPMKNKEGMEAGTASTSTPPSAATATPTPPAKPASGGKVNPTPTAPLPTVVNPVAQAGNNTSTQESKEPVGNPASEPFTGKFANAERVDSAASMTQAFTNLENMLGGDGIARLSSDTHHLVENQAKLFKTIENMTPLIAKASSLMEKFSKF